MIAPRRKPRRQRGPAVYEGNRGGDYLTIKRAGAAMIELEVGHQCVVALPNQRVPVVFLTAVVAQALAVHKDVAGVLRAAGWSEAAVQALLEDGLP